MTTKRCPYNYTFAIDNDLFNNVQGDQKIKIDMITFNDNQFQILADLPGCSKENIHLTMVDNKNQLELSVQMPASTKEDKDVRYIHKERNGGKILTRLITLPQNIDRNKIEANFENGVLEVVLHKSEHTHKRFIEIK